MSCWALELQRTSVRLLSPWAMSCTRSCRERQGIAENCLLSPWAVELQKTHPVSSSLLSSRIPTAIITASSLLTTQVQFPSSTPWSSEINIWIRKRRGQQTHFRGLQPLLFQLRRPAITVFLKRHKAWKKYNIILCQRVSAEKLKWNRSWLVQLVVLPGKACPLKNCIDIGADGRWYQRWNRIWLVQLVVLPGKACPLWKSAVI